MSTTEYQAAASQEAVLSSPLASVAVDLIPWTEALARFLADEPMFWLRIFERDSPCPGQLFSSLGTTTKVCTFLHKPFPFPKFEPEHIWLNPPQKGQLGFWFGKPVSFERFSQLKGQSKLARWWREQGAFDGWNGVKLLEGANHFRKQFLAGNAESDWTTRMDGLIDYGYSWVNGVALNVPALTPDQKPNCRQPQICVAKIIVGRFSYTLGATLSTADRAKIRPMLQYAFKNHVEPKIIAVPEQNIW